MSRGINYGSRTSAYYYRIMCKLLYWRQMKPHYISGMILIAILFSYFYFLVSNRHNEPIEYYKISKYEYEPMFKANQKYWTESGLATTVKASEDRRIVYGHVGIANTLWAWDSDTGRLIGMDGIIGSSKFKLTLPQER